MDYEMAWDEMKRWLKHGETYLISRQVQLKDSTNLYSQKEFIRISGKLDGIQTCIYHMEESERLYGDSENQQ